MTFDWTKMNALLGVIHSASTAGPKFAKFAQAADDELTAMWDAAQPPRMVEIPDPPAEVIGALDAKEVETAKYEHEDEPELPITQQRRI